ncbi:hypothetical protein MTR_0052s0170 [Medicago truncatula]|uniref:Uncharacterized protein n=1 Tax=Medicago truncatula TaxID=3880 RepID=A0A072TII3_MEDTR|nr:hypothetical protein MTR_0052s0170 [Medicago truncatula]
MAPIEYYSRSGYDEAFGYLKRVIVTPAVYPRLVEFLHFDIQSTGQKSHCVNIRRDHRNTCSRRGSSSSSPPTADGFETGTPVPSPQSQSFSRGYGSILPTSLAYIVPSTRGCSPWRPDAVMSTTGHGRHSVLRIFKGRQGRTGHHATCGALPAAGPYLRLSRFHGGQHFNNLGLGHHHNPRRSMSRADWRTGKNRSPSDRDTSPAPICFPPDNFKHSLSLFSKSFSSFPRRTCSLSVSRQYLALDGIYRPIGAAFPNNPTRRQRPVVRQGPSTTGLSPSPAPLSRGLGPGPQLRTLLHTTIRTPRATDSHGGLIPVRSPLLRESLLVSFPPLIDMLKFSRRALNLMASGATCVQRLDGSRDSAIHTKYRISLRSSSMQEPRYPLPRVILYNVSKHNTHENRLRCHAGVLREKFKFLDAFSLFSRLRSRSLTELTRQIAPPTKNGHAPPPIESRKSSQSVNPYYVWTCGVLKATSVDPWQMLSQLFVFHKSKNFTSDYEIQMPPTVPVNHYSDPEGQHNRIRILCAGGTTRPIKARSASPAEGTSQPVHTIGGPIDPTQAGITAAAGTRLALQWILIKGFRLYSFQLPDSMSPVLLFIVTTSPCYDWVICAPAAFLPNLSKKFDESSSN